MSLPTKTDLLTIDWAYKGQSFVDIPSKSAVDLKTMDWSFQAQSFVSNPAEAAPPPPAANIFMGVNV